MFLRRTACMKWISGTRLGLLTSGGLRDLQKSPFRSTCFPSVPWFVRKLFLRLCARYRTFRRFFSPVPPTLLETSGLFTTAETAILGHLWVCHHDRGDQLYSADNWNYSNTAFILGITKRSRFRLAWCRPCTDRGEIEPTSVFHEKTDLGQISSRSVDIWEYGSRKKTVFDL